MEWKVHVNLEKTKVMVCSAMTPKNLLWIFPYNSIVEITDRYKYFGVILQPNSSLKHVCDYLAARASKAYFALKRKLPFDFTLSTAMWLKQYNFIIVPYSSEIWISDFKAKKNYFQRIFQVKDQAFNNR